MSDKGWDTDDEVGGSASFRPPAASGADAWGAPEPHVPAIPVDDVPQPVAWTPDVAPEPEPVRQPDPVWAAPAPSPEPAWAPAPEPEPVRQPDPVWAVPEPATQPEPAWAPAPEPAAVDPWATPAQPASDPWGMTPASVAAAGAVTGDASTPTEIPTAPGPLSDRLAHAAPVARPTQADAGAYPTITPSSGPNAPLGAQQAGGTRPPVSTGTGATPAAAAAGWPTATPAATQPGAAEWPAATQGAAAGAAWSTPTGTPGAGTTQARPEMTPGTAAAAGAAAGYAAAQQPPAATAAASGGAWSTGTADPRAAAWPAEQRSPYAPPSGAGQSGYAQQPAGGWPQATYPQGQAGYGQTGYTQGGWSGQPGYGQQPTASQSQWASQSPAAQQAAWAAYMAQQAQQGQQPQAGYGQPQQGSAAAWSQPVQPGQASWGSTNASYWATEEPAVQAGYGRSLGVVFAGILLFVFGTLVAIAGVMVFAVGASVDLNAYLDQVGLVGVDRDQFQELWDLGIGVAPFLAAIGILELLAGLLVLAHRTFGRVLGLLFGLGGTVLGGLAAVVMSQVPPATQSDGSIVDVAGTAVPLGVITAIYVFIFLALAAGGKHFRRGSDA